METTKAYKKYMKLYGPHFTKALCDFATGLMETNSGPIKPITKQEIDDKLKSHNITL